MKAVIDNRTYNTETATELGTWRSGRDFTKFYYEEATLYRSRRGNYFLAWNRMPPHRRAEIEPLTREQASRWAQEHSIDADVIEAEFRDLIEQA